MYSTVTGANTANTLYRNVYLRGQNGVAPVDPNSLSRDNCINAAPHCYLSAGTHRDTGVMSVEQDCTAQFVPKPLDEQLREGRVYGQSLCGNTLTSVTEDVARGQVTIDEFEVEHKRIQHTHRLFYTRKQEKQREEYVQQERPSACAVEMSVGGYPGSGFGENLSHRCDYSGQRVSCILKR